MKVRITEYRGIDVVKFIMSFAVVAIHEPEYLFPDNRVYPSLFDWFIRLAVPFFFVASGFLIFQRIKSMTECESRAYLLGKSRKIFRLWLCWMLVYLPLSIWGMSHENISTQQLFLQYIQSCLLTGASLYAHPLWFLYSMAFAFLIWGLVAPGCKGLSFGLLFAAYSIFPLMSYLFGYQYPIFKSVAERIMGGRMPILAGCIIASWLFGSNKSVALVISGMSSLVLYYLKLPYYPFFGAICLLAISSYLSRPSFSLNSLTLRKCSMWIYYTHMYVIMALMVIYRMKEICVNRWITLSFVCAICFAIALLLNRLANFPRFKFLNFFIS